MHVESKDDASVEVEMCRDAFDFRDFDGVGARPGYRALDSTSPSSGTIPSSLSQAHLSTSTSRTKIV